MRCEQLTVLHRSPWRSGYHVLPSSLYPWFESLRCLIYFLLSERLYLSSVLCVFAERYRPCVKGTFHPCFFAKNGHICASHIHEYSVGMSLCMLSRWHVQAICRALCRRFHVGDLQGAIPGTVTWMLSSLAHSARAMTWVLAPMSRGGLVSGLNGMLIANCTSSWRVVVTSKPVS